MKPDNIKIGDVLYEAVGSYRNGFGIEKNKVVFVGNVYIKLIGKKGEEKYKIEALGDGSITLSDEFGFGKIMYTKESSAVDKVKYVELYKKLQKEFDPNVFPRLSYDQLQRIEQITSE